MKLHALVETLDAARAAVEGGATVVQLRRKGASTGELVDAGAGFAELGVTLVVNDDVQAALRLAADGVHLGRGDPGAEQALAEGLLLGRSVATRREAAVAEHAGAGYLGAGPVWATPSKPDAGAPIGLDGLREICQSVEIPVVAIGGVTAANAAECIRAGASGVAVIRGLAEIRELAAAL